MRQLFIDLDGVLAAFDQHYETCFGIKLDRARDAGIENPDGMFDRINAHGRFFRELPALPDALDLWEGAKKLHPDPIILTGIAYGVDGCADHKREWVKEYISESAKVICCRSRDKRNYGRPGDILIDDWHKYKHLWEEMGGVFILHKNAADSLEEAATIMDRNHRFSLDQADGFRN